MWCNYIFFILIYVHEKEKKIIITAKKKIISYP